MRVMTAMCRARLSRRSPPRLSPQGVQIAVSATRSPRDCPVHAGAGGGELLGGNQFAGPGDQNGEGVSSGVGVHPDDIGASVRDDRHGERASFQTDGYGSGRRTAGAGLDGSHFGATL